MNRKRYVLLSLLLIVLLAISVTAYARSGYLSDFNNMYGTSGTRLDDCVLCHINTQTRNPYGAAIESYILLGFEAMNAISIVEPYDSDGDGSVNIDEISALTFPGDASDYPSGPACTDSDGDTFAIEGGSCGPVDCNDADPLVNPGAVEACTDGVDNDCDALTDCDDAADCGGDPACVVCTDSDGDTYAVDGGSCGPVDCNDADPAVNPAAAEVCDDTVDNDCDGQLDCDDLDCAGSPACPECLDNDGDLYFVPITNSPACGTEDCNDSDPLINPGAAEVCDDIVDNDCNGLADCADSSCSEDPACAGTCVPTSDNEKGPKCTDGLDNDCDGVLDCADPDCSKAKACK